ncbi:MAG: phospholipase D-like domain-containing protein [Bacteriovoracaceae bacterium]
MNVCVQNKNVWCIDKVNHLGFLLDADKYYSAFFEALPQARKNIFITAWEMESKLNLGKVSSRFPSDLRKYFSFLVSQNENLKIKILCWKPGLYLKFSRERLSEWKWRELGHPRVNFKNDRSPFAFGSFHEKLVLIDNSCGFLGGMDVSVNRWDTSDHLLGSDLRGKENPSYLPIHDAQFIFKGSLLEKMRIMMQARLNPDYVNIEQFPERQIKIETPYPYIEDTIASLSRTDPALKAYEIESLYIDAIMSAKKFIYIENQYFTCESIAKALAKQLEKQDGPEVIIVLPLNYLGSFERAIYINGRNEIKRILEKANKYNRLGFYYPSIPEESERKFLKVHSKIMIVDGKFITLGSANLNYRSMRVDREMNMNLEAINEKNERFIKDIFKTLLCEHLGIQLEDYDDSVSVLTNINKYQNYYPRTMKNLEYGVLSLKEKPMLLISSFVDMKKAVPKTLFWSIITLIMIFLLFSMKTAYDIL